MAFNKCDSDSDGGGPQQRKYGDGAAPEIDLFSVLRNNVIRSGDFGLQEVQCARLTVGSEQTFASVLLALVNPCEGFALALEEVVDSVEVVHCFTPKIKRVGY